MVDSTLAGVVFNNGLLVGGTGETDTVDSDGSNNFTFGGDGGLGIFLGAGTLDNQGTIIGGSGKQAGGNGVDVYGAFGATLINNATISGGLGIGGTIADAVLFGAATVASTLVVDPGGIFIGAVSVAGSAPDMILLGAGTGQTPGTLDMGGSFSGFDTISFEPGTAWQLSGDAAELAEGQVIDGFALRDTIILSGFTAMTHGYVEGAGLELSNGTVTETLDIVGSFSTGSFAVSDTSQGTEILLCHLRGTRIATPAGEVTVEALKIGDAVITRFGGYRRIKWIGRQSFGARFIRGNRNQVPVRIMAGALGGSLPRRDLFVSPGHSLLLGGALILARDLVNGVTVTQNDRVDDVHYYHIEFETHDCLLAEGVWSESFCDYADLRGQFHNATEFWSHYPMHVTQTEHLMCAPRPEAGPALAAALYPVTARAAALATPGPLRGCIDEVSPTGLIRGWAQDIASPELPVLLEIALGTINVGTILACDHRQDLTDAGIGTGRASFNFHGPHLTPDQRADIIIRRAADGASLDAGTGRYHERAA